MGGDGNGSVRWGGTPPMPGQTDRTNRAIDAQPDVLRATYADRLSPRSTRLFRSGRRRREGG